MLFLIAIFGMMGARDGAHSQIRNESQLSLKQKVVPIFGTTFCSEY